ncbi:MAG: hypothetical protein A4E45_01897 [Methanosaeta sp. PtaB.Bin039]|nr:MAG: hypothetical protein A4E45_01897 [Methanosaeta sp. PtaB.Bin039]HOT07033.1 UDP-N-acetylglucosamine 2-epimerase (non-hydrolyzing) [Methanotrichaceae archaeon]HQF16039.1 UDP-N-acetylglucosamine 2-epimerase (non-hydrolyzing) [Methanotrichaceae archaeon]HQI90845.1 UDP-N-acetylglucosamine 2-epimerase (non-hydrolyzing) [Methanotrichaceae archaeon]HQJ28199.1 UDP-N-acetylglucosamine 2-epimerase (non-hydrolyzing) [Methanotrichaceae archaeon]
MRKVVSVVGARPNFVKLAPVSRELRKEFAEVIIHTGQHYDYLMDQVFFEQMGIAMPDFHLGVGSGTHGRQTGEMLAAVEKVLMDQVPDMVLVFGDTNTTLAGALAAAKLHIPVVHVEAGLRSFDRRMPEEVNRVLVDHCSDILSCPTITAVDNLRKEGIERGVHLTGDVMVDSMQDCLRIASGSASVLEDLGLSEKGYILATVHRAENTDHPARLESICQALAEVARHIEVVFPCHPRTVGRLKAAGLWEELTSRVMVVDPVGYLEMLVLEAAARKVLTDSGGVQKEAYMLGVPCITLRETTEWVETVQDGWNVLVGAERSGIIRAAIDFLPSGPRKEVFGRPGAASRLVELLSASQA